VLALLTVTLIAEVADEEEAMHAASEAERAARLNFEHQAEIHGMDRAELERQIRVLGAHATLVPDAAFEEVE